MIPISLSLSGFLSYRDPVTIDFTTFELACISGHNGAGKSSLLDAITWVLFGQARKRDDSLIHSHPEVKAAEVILIFEYEGDVYRVQRTLPRGKSTQLEVQIRQSGDGRVSATWKPLTESTLRKTQEKLEKQILRMDYDTFVNASFFLQGKADLFTKQSPGDRKRILSSILGLDVWEEYQKKAAERRKKLESEVDRIEGSLFEINAELSKEAEWKQRLQECEAQLKRKEAECLSQERIVDNFRQIVNRLADRRRWVEEQRKQVEEASRRLEELETQLQSRREELASFTQLVEQEGAIRAAHTAWQKAREDLDQWEKVAERFREQEARRQEPLAEIRTAQGALQAEKEKLQEQQKQVERLRLDLPEIRGQIESLNAQIQQAEDKLQQRPELEAVLREWDQRLADKRAENQRLKEEMEELKNRIDQLQQLEEAFCPLCGQPLSPEDQAKLIESLAAQGREMGDRFRANQAWLRQSDQERQKIEQQIAELRSLEGRLRDINRRLDQLQLQDKADTTALEEWEANGAPRLAEITRMLEEESYSPEARRRLQEIDAELKAIGYDAAAHEAARLAESQGRQAEQQLRELERALASRSNLEREIATYESLHIKQRADFEQLRSEYKKAAEELAVAEAQAPDVDAAELELRHLEEQKSQLQKEVGAALQWVRTLDSLRLRLKELQDKKDELTLQIGRYKQLERAFSKDGVPALLIEQALPQIEAKANEILDRLSMGSMSVRFLTQAAYKDKRREDLKETLDILISDGVGTRDYEMFSGGEAFRVDFAIRLALSEILAQRASARLRMLVIDEGFGSQDAQGRQRLIEAINLVKPDFAKILVITHIDELKEAFPNRLEVEKTPRGSSVRVI